MHATGPGDEVRVAMTILVHMSVLHEKHVP